MTDKQKQVVDLAIKLYFDQPFWRRWAARKHLLNGTTTSTLWKESVRVAYYMLRDAKAMSWVQHADNAAD